MGQTGQTERVYGGKWTTVSLIQTEMGLTARERFERFKLEAASELVLRLAGGLMVAGSTLLWLVLPVEAGREQVISHSVLATLFTATGLIVYAYGTRGFRRQLSLDAKRGTLSLTKININDQARVARTIDIDDIESLFLRRPSSRPGFASLYVRVSGSETPQMALTGDTKELEVIHKELCEVIQAGTEHAANAAGRARAAAHAYARVRV